MFSVIIPSFNKIDFISISIQSVLNQTLSGFEIIVIDDGSTDGSLDLLKRYETTNSNIHIIFQKNMGVSMTRNNGAKAAKYEYLAFLDADDWWENTFLEEMKSFIENYPNAGLYSSNFSIVKNGNRIESKFNIQTGFIDYFESYVFCGFRQPIYSSCAVIPKVVFNKLSGFMPNIKIGEDFYLWTKIALEEKIAYLNKNLSNYNQDSNINFRATKKIHNPKSNYVYYFSDFKEFEAQNKYLKILLDHIRIGNYMRSVSSGVYLNESINLLNDVDFSKQSSYINILCKLPIRIASVILILDKYYNYFKRKIIKFI